MSTFKEKFQFQFNSSVNITSIKYSIDEQKKKYSFIPNNKKSK